MRPPIWLYPGSQGPPPDPNGNKSPSASDPPEPVFLPELLGSSDTPLLEEFQTRPTFVEPFLDLLPWPVEDFSFGPTLEEFQTRPGVAEAQIDPPPADLLGSIDAPLLTNAAPEIPAVDLWHEPLIEPLPLELLGSSDTPLADDALTRPSQSEAWLDVLPGPLLGSVDQPLAPVPNLLPSASEPFLDLLPYGEQPQALTPALPPIFWTPRASEAEMWPAPEFRIDGSEIVRPQIVATPPVNSQPCPTQVDMPWVMPEILGGAFAPLRTGTWSPSATVRPPPKASSTRARVEAME